MDKTELIRGEIPSNKVEIIKGDIGSARNELERFIQSNVKNIISLTHILYYFNNQQNIIFVLVYEDKNLIR